MVYTKPLQSHCPLQPKKNGDKVETNSNKRWKIGAVLAFSRKKQKTEELIRMQVFLIFIIYVTNLLTMKHESVPYNVLDKVIKEAIQAQEFIISPRGTEERTTYCTPSSFLYKKESQQTIVIRAQNCKRVFYFILVHMMTMARKIRQYDIRIRQLEGIMHLQIKNLVNECYRKTALWLSHHIPLMLSLFLNLMEKWESSCIEFNNRTADKL
ncbi:hypothetical protein Glove_326g49 [Diversispora epigaea]|uniref:Uncharacterized protein n=1 Tax=Diversispora epigaea TaxID=1348612 RepID=A0A397HM30_9GLOM|nr:hypothetical protein Glove_326g49 [Diversispora epigaea]